MKDAAPRGDEIPVLGIDIGSVSVACALSGGRTPRWGYRFHHGKVTETLASLLTELSPPSPTAVAITSSSPRVLPAARVVDPQVCLIRAARALYEKPGSILFVGGERFGLIRLDGAGNYLGARSNSSCAAGTGSFLDQQARRLGLGSISALAQAALKASGEPPKISTRCAVFARTDLVHAQAAGFGLEEICAGLCRGLARNIAETLLAGERPRPPVVFAGGVALNEAVRSELERLFKAPVVSHELSPVLAAYGACLDALESRDDLARVDGEGLSGLLAPEASRKSYYYAPLDLEDGDRPHERKVVSTGRYSSRHPVELEVYKESEGAPVFMGIDIGSTSTKAILIGKDLEPVLGLYTRTSGAPSTAVQALCEVLSGLEASRGMRFDFLGVGTTGAGRKFTGRIIGADLVVDEITAHAKAAYALEPGIDTIIEIGGQDAKFTTMRDGMVTFSHMNTVCAAGTGSFLEEQAVRLECGLDAYEDRVRGARAPLVSDRCAVFMERDINNYLARGYSSEEILAAALYSVRENYLTKVARGAAIGNKICFQGAVARNKALVAAFEQGLGKRIFVSPYCHLTGALGVALLLAEAMEEAPAPTTFRGLEALTASEIPIRGETCGLCANHCRIRIASVSGETVAYGFLCGRDYDTAHFVNNNTSGFDITAEWKKAFRRNAAEAPAQALRTVGRRSATHAPVIGIPAALSLVEHLPLWESFFTELGIRTVTSEHLSGSIASGKGEAKAEFCAPLVALHGHVRFLLEKADFVFLPLLLEGAGDGFKRERSYCYYTQFSSALVSSIREGEASGRCLMPVVSFHRRLGRTRRELFRSLKAAGFPGIRRSAVRRALDRAIADHDKGLAHLRGRFLEETRAVGDPAVVLIGRPYTVHSPEMNKSIPQIFASLGVKTFSQEMIPVGRPEEKELEALLKDLHWVHAAAAMKAALVAARTPLLYPVFVTCFKCSPDSFAMEYFKRIMDRHQKPYLILQLDDHDSNVGYETRIEAGIASFRNHARTTNAAHAFSEGTPGPTPLERSAKSAARADSERGQSVRQPRVVNRASLNGRTLFFPNWDPLVVPLVAANLRREGIDAWPLSEDPVRIRKAMRHNTGQCIPLNIIAQDFIEEVEGRGLDPERAALWMAGSGVACNISMFSAYFSYLFEAYGRRFEKASVYEGDISHIEISLRAALNAYKAHLLGGLLRRTGCRLRPYEAEKGATDRAIKEAMGILSSALERGRSLGRAVAQAAALFDAVALQDGEMRRPKPGTAEVGAAMDGVRRRPKPGRAEVGAAVDGVRRRPKAAVFGDMYARDNDVLNQDLIHAIEEAGGEAVATPYTEYVQIVAQAYFQKWFRSRDYLKSVGMRLLFNAMKILAAGYRRQFERFLGKPARAHRVDADAFLARFGVRSEHAGESYDNLLKVAHLALEHPDLKLFVQTSPAFCCPALVTEAMARDIQRVTGVPVVSLTYDGTGQYRNDAIVPYLSGINQSGAPGA